MTAHPIVDARPLAADISYAYWLVQINQGEVSDAAEAEYVRPVPDDFTREQASQLAGDVLTWTFTDPEEGLLAKAEFEDTRQLLGRAAALMSNLEDVEPDAVANVIGEFVDHESYCKEQYEESRGPREDIGDLTYDQERRVTLSGLRILRDVILPGSEEIKDLLLSGFVGRGWIKFLQNESR